MPSNYDVAVEIFVKPMDLPLLNPGQKIRFFFDGWPSVIFSGWPSISYGTYGGVIIAVDTYKSQNGKYRVLVTPDSSDYPWPRELSIGSGATGIALLKNVPIWYEIWRNLCGFPPEYYVDKVN